MSESKKQVFIKGVAVDAIPKIRYDFYFRLFGLVSVGLDGQSIGPMKGAPGSGSATLSSGGSRLRRGYCKMVCCLLWFFAIRSFVLMFIPNRDLQVMLGDLTGFWNEYRMYYLMPMFFISLQTAITSTIFISKEQNLTWLVPFISVKQIQTGNTTGGNNFRIGPHKLRIFLGIVFDLAIVLLLTVAVALLYYDTAIRNFDTRTFNMWLPWLVLHVIWFFYMGGVTFVTCTYFNLICLLLKTRFAVVCKDIENLADQEVGPPGSKNQALTTLYFEHNEVCEVVDESNTFWQSYIFFTYMTYIPCSCYVLYNLFFADFDDLLGTVTWTAFIHTVVLIGFISISAAGVSAEAHAPYTALHTLSLLQLPIDLEVNMSTFLHRVRGPTIGFSCLDLFVVTNASISNTMAAVASYFLIVADFSRSTVAASQATSLQPTINATDTPMLAALTAAHKSL